MRFTSEQIEELASVLCAALPDVGDLNRARHWTSRSKANQVQWRRVAQAAMVWHDEQAPADADE